MKYCEKCKKLFNDNDEKCADCGKILSEVTDENTSVFLISAAGFELQRIKNALEDSGIPCDMIAKKKNTSAEAVTGYDNSEYDIIVPYSAYEKSYDVCIGIGAIKEDETEIIDSAVDEPTNKDAETLDEQFEEMSGTKRTTVRIVSAVLLIILVALVIYGTDAITGLIKGLF